MYSRRARKESDANKVSEPFLPTTSVSAKIALIFHHARVLAFKLSITRREDSDSACDYEQCEHPTKKGQQAGIGLVPNKLDVAPGGVILHRQHHSFPFRRSERTAARERARNSCLFSLPSTRIGEPKVSTLTSGTGRISPFGRMRFRFSRYAGISSTSGRRFARWYKPLLNSPTVSPAQRVPSGKKIRESRSPIASAS